jgi:hypothetical protein
MPEKSFTFKLKEAKFPYALCFIAPSPHVSVLLGVATYRDMIGQTIIVVSANISVQAWPLPASQLQPLRLFSGLALHLGLCELLENRVSTKVIFFTVDEIEISTKF